jgi:hypothetical protein
LRDGRPATDRLLSGIGGLTAQHREARTSGSAHDPRRTRTKRVTR